VLETAALHHGTFLVGVPSSRFWADQQTIRAAARAVGIFIYWKWGFDLGGNDERSFVTMNPVLVFLHRVYRFAFRA
jgi:hypothetical protein